MPALERQRRAHAVGDLVEAIFRLRFVKTMFFDIRRCFFGNSVRAVSYELQSVRVCGGDGNLPCTCR